MALDAKANVNQPEKNEMLMFVRAIAAVAAAYVFFLLFAEFAFLELVRQSGGSEGNLRVIMSVLGAAGIAGSLAPCVENRFSKHPLSLAFGFTLCAIAAALSLVSNSATIAVAAALTGFGAGWTTVVLATHLKNFCGARALPFVCGLGTGIAYVICNLPPVFETSPRGQTTIALIFASCGVLVAPRLTAVKRETSHEISTLFSPSVIVTFFALVWLDSAAFFIIQHTEALKQSTWWTGDYLLSGALVHFSGALAAAFLLRWNSIATVLLLAVGCLALACLSLHTSASAASTSILYNSGVSLYSTALVWVPASVGKVRFSAALYSIAGWISSAFAIGMAQDLHRIPTVVIAIACGAVLLGVAAFIRR